MTETTFKTLAGKHKTLWSDKYFVWSSFFGLVLFFFSLFINYFAVQYAALRAGNYVPDILLDNLPVLNTDLIFSEGALFFVIVIIFLMIFNPKIIPFTLKNIALFISIRAVFVVMTHLGIIPDRINTDFDTWRFISSGADLFFSGHTGLPFLMALLFWENKLLRHIFIILSIVAAFAVIFGHLHYTIDIFSAYFITYGIYHIARRFFPRDYRIFNTGTKLDVFEI